MILILKIPNANSVDKFHPIVLGNFISKIITKILADRLAPIAARIIDPHQFRFMKDRNIKNCITVAS